MPCVGVASRDGVRGRVQAKELQVQYRFGLESLNENLPEVKADLVLAAGTDDQYFVTLVGLTLV